MTRQTLYIAVTLALIGFTACKKDKKQVAFADQKIEIIQSKLDSLAALNNKVSDSLLLEKLEQLSKSDEEAKIKLSYNYYYRLDEPEIVDSLTKLSIKKFPKGIQTRFAEYQKIFSKDSLNEQINQYDAWVKQFPPENYSFDDRDIYNIAIYYLLEKSVNQNKAALTTALKNRLLDHPSKVNTLYNMAVLYLNNGQIDLSKTSLDKGLAEIDKWFNNSNLTKESKKVLESRHLDLLRLYAFLLAENDECNKAIDYFEAYKNETNFIDTEANLKYADCLEATGQKTKAFEQLKEVVKLHDQVAEENYPRFKSLFLESQGNEQDFAALEKAMQQELDASLKEEVIENMITEKAPEFSLIKMNGEKISSSDLKDKILVVDFWATWCAPCKASFPAMQQVKDHYNDDPNIKFLFVNTMESGLPSEVKPKIEKLLKSNSYDFEMFLDTKDDSNTYKMAKAYQIKAIPYKFIIDGEGNIRYKIKGYEGNLEIEKKKLIAMINAVKDKQS
ncbi:TlpA disulfide reductase family protein [Zunongwangia sp. HGR-M22]|uniref:TlpA disulfide reductase family protein n=1 Tax=Zunongwangia sp. HGR-M22 TaxID=3015168 RepID=UPI0022DD11DD|nr:TlpA disulfide reductase family protein [Zunongwangia sp. HGR-M22]WBL25028.1 TlpA disulfide reductase family protein [Zunongwangia sp. HGR-M22]